jgi:hypothetical protein
VWWVFWIGFLLIHYPSSLWQPNLSTSPCSRNLFGNDLGNEFPQALVSAEITLHSAHSTRRILLHPQSQPSAPVLLAVGIQLGKRTISLHYIAHELQTTSRSIKLEFEKVKHPVMFTAKQKKPVFVNWRQKKKVPKLLGKGQTHTSTGIICNHVSFDTASRNRIQ